MENIHLISAMYSSQGHGKEYIANFSEKLHTHFNINLFQASGSETSKSNPFLESTLIKVDYSKTDSRNFSKYGVFSSYFRALSKQYHSLKYYQGIIQSSKIKKGDIVFIMDYDVLPLNFLVKELSKKGAEIFLWIHSAKFKSKDLLYMSYKSIFKYFFTQKIRPKINKVIVNGDFISKQLKKELNLPEELIEVIQYPSKVSFSKIEKEEARVRLGFSSEENIVLFFGLLRADKNIELLIKSIAEANSSIKLIIAGAESSVTRSDLLRWISQYGLDNYYLDTKYLSDEEISLYYSCSDLLVLTYHFESASQSGPLSLAREFKLPALVSGVGEIGSYVKSNNVGFTADINSPNSFSQKIDEFFEMDEGTKVDLERNIEIAQKKFSWDRAAEKYINLFSN